MTPSSSVVSHVRGHGPNCEGISVKLAIIGTKTEWGNNDASIKISVLVCYRPGKWQQEWGEGEGGREGREGGEGERRCVEDVRADQAGKWKVTPYECNMDTQWSNPKRMDVGERESLFDIIIQCNIISLSSKSTCSPASAPCCLNKQCVAGERVDLLDDYDVPARTITEIISFVTISHHADFSRTFLLVRILLTVRPGIYHEQLMTREDFIKGVVYRPLFFFLGGGGGGGGTQHRLTVKSCIKAAANVQFFKFWCGFY